MTDVLVLGAGVAGVTAARALAAAGLSVVVVEGRQRVGGRVHSVRDFCERPVEAGAEFIHGGSAATWPEVRDAKLSVRACHQRHMMFNAGGATRWLPWVLLHPGVWPTFTIFRALSRARPPDQSAREFLERRGYRGRARLFAEMVLTGHLPGCVDEIGVLGLLDDGIHTLERGTNYRIEEGYDRLPQHLAEGLDVRLGFEIATVRWDAGGVAVVARDGRELAARSAISTLPVGVLASQRVRFSPVLPEAKRAALDRVEMGPVVKVLLRFQERFWPRWANAVGCATGPVTLYWPVFHGEREAPPVLVAYATGDRARLLGRVGEAEAVEIALSDLRRLFPGADPKRALSGARRIDWSADPFACGGYTFLRPDAHGARQRLAAADTGALFWAGSATQWDPIADTVEAAYASGLRAAGEVCAQLVAPRFAANRRSPSPVRTVLATSG
jgi:monoamine oxidase